MGAQSSPSTVSLSAFFKKSLKVLIVALLLQKYREVFLRGGLVVSGSDVYISERFDNARVSRVCSVTVGSSIQQEIHGKT